MNFSTQAINHLDRGVDVSPAEPDLEIWLSARILIYYDPRRQSKDITIQWLLDVFVIDYRPGSIDRKQFWTQNWMKIGNELSFVTQLR